MICVIMTNIWFNYIHGKVSFIASSKQESSHRYRRRIIQQILFLQVPSTGKLAYKRMFEINISQPCLKIKQFYWKLHLILQ